MTSKHLFFKLQKEDLKQRLWSAALLCLAFFFVFPVRLALVPGEYRQMRGDEELRAGQIIARSQAWFRIENGYIVVIMIFAAIILAVSGFSYLHSKKRIDFYHSLPVRRELLFLVNFVDGILLMAVPYLLCMIIGLGVAATNGTPVIMTCFKIILPTFGFHMIYFILMYATSVIAMLMAGKRMVATLGITVFYIYAPVLSLLITGYYSSFFNSYSGMESWFSKLNDISPISAYMNAINSLANEEPLAAALFTAVGVSVLLILLGMFLYRKRMSEAAEKAMAFPLSKAPIKFLLVIPLGMAFALFFWAMRSSMAWGIFGLLCGVTISHAVIEIIYHSDFRKLLSHKLHMALCGAVVLVILLVFRMDLIGYDKYLPESSKVESVAITASETDDWVQYGKYEFTSEGSLRWKWHSRTAIVLEDMELKDVETVLSIAEMGIISEAEIADEAEWWSDRDYRDPRNRTSHVTIRYNLKGGAVRYRSYRIPSVRIYDQIGQIYGQEDYKTSAYPIYKTNADNVQRMEYEQIGTNTLIPRDTQSYERILTAYRQDFMDTSLADRNAAFPIGTLSYTEYPEEYLDKETEYEAQNHGRNSSIYPVYASFARTIGELESCGVEMKLEPDFRQIKSIEVENYLYSKYDETQLSDAVGDEILQTIDIEDGTVRYSYDDPAQIAKIMENLVFYDYTTYNDWIGLEGDMSAQVTIGSGIQAKSYPFNFIVGQIPEFVKADLMYK